MTQVFLTFLFVGLSAGFLVYLCRGGREGGVEYRARRRDAKRYFNDRYGKQRRFRR